MENSSVKLCDEIRRKEVKADERAHFADINKKRHVLAITQCNVISMYNTYIVMNKVKRKKNKQERYDSIHILSAASQAAPLDYKCSVIKYTHMRHMNDR